MFFLNDTATTEIYTLSLHDALPIWVLSPEDVATLAEGGIATVVAARLEPGDVHEDEAAERIARAVQGSGLAASAAVTGRVNLLERKRTRLNSRPAKSLSPLFS